MGVITSELTDRYAVYNGDCIEVMKSLPDQSIGLSVYSPPFCGLYHYSSSERDLSNCRSYDEFFTHYEFVVRELYRLTPPGRATAVHCMDVPGDGANVGGNTIDFPGDIIRLHQRLGWRWKCRYHVWKEPMEVRNRTMAKGLAHKQLVEDSTLCDNAMADQLLVFVKPGENKNPVSHPTGLDTYAGSREVPRNLLPWRGWKGNQIENKYSHWIWRQYASAFWDDVRLNRVLPYRDCREPDDERHMHPLQLDAIERACVLWSNRGDVVFTPFMGVGSEVYGAVINGRMGVGVELQPKYYRQALLNLEDAANGTDGGGGEYETKSMLNLLGEDEQDDTADEPTPEPEAKPKRKRKATTAE